MAVIATLAFIFIKSGVGPIRLLVFGLLALNAAINLLGYLVKECAKYFRASFPEAFRQARESVKT